MPESEASPSPQTEQAQPAPVTSMESLDAAMAATRATSAAQTSSTDQAAPDRTAPSARADQASDDTSAQPADNAAQEGDDEGDAPATAPGEPPRPSRMGRLRDQLTQAEQRTRAAEAQYQQRMAQDAAVADKYRGLLGSPEERAQLNSVLANPSATTHDVNQARSRLAQMTQAATELAPLRHEVERSVFDHFTRGMEQLRTLDGMDEQAHQSLFKAPSGVDALKIMHSIGEKAAEEKFKGEVSSLKTQLADTKRQLAAAGTQPARAGGVAPGRGTNGLAGQLGPDGLPTEEAIEAAKRGAFRSLGVPSR